MKTQPWDSLAVLLVDMQGHLTRTLEKTVLDALLSNMFRIIEHCKRHDIPIIVIEGFNPGLDDEEHVLGCLQDALEGASLVRVIEKQGSPDPFSNPALEAHLRSLGTQRVLASGIFASYCMLHGCRSAVARGYEVITSDDLMADAPDMVREPWRTDWYREACSFGPGWERLIGMPAC